MQRVRGGKAARVLLGSIGLWACGQSSPPRVEFKDSSAFGTWYADALLDGESAPEPTHPSDPEPGAGASQGGAPAMVPPAADGGRGGGRSVAEAGEGGAGGSAGSSANAGGKGGMGSSGMPVAPKEVLALEFTTRVQHMGALDKLGTCIGSATAKDGCWGPENAGAVWIETAGGEFVKTLELWIGIKSEAHLIHYAASRGEQRIDIVASASRRKDNRGAVPNPAHVVTWDGSDRTKQVLPAGPYKLFAEVADCNANPSEPMHMPGCEPALLVITFDTQNRTSMVPDAEFFEQVKFTLR